MSKKKNKKYPEIGADPIRSNPEPEVKETAPVPIAPYKEWQTFTISHCSTCECKVWDRRPQEQRESGPQCPVCQTVLSPPEGTVKLDAWPTTFLPSIFVIQE